MSNGTPDVQKLLGSITNVFYGDETLTVSVRSDSGNFYGQFELMGYQMLQRGSLVDLVVLGYIDGDEEFNPKKLYGVRVSRPSMTRGLNQGVLYDMNKHSPDEIISNDLTGLLSDAHDLLYP
jgi:hypothetical protein